MLDKNYTSKEWEQLWKDLDSVKESKTYQEEQKKEYKTKNYGVNDFGIGASFMGKYQDPIQGVLAEIRGGAGHIELTTSLNGQGYKSFTKLSGQQRRALREIKKINDFSIGVHADSNVMGLTGFDQRSFSFNEEQRHQNISKIKEAIDFAADVSEGGAITFHAGDFIRPVSGTNYGKGGTFSRGVFDKNEMVIGVVDSKSNQFIKESWVKIGDSLTVPVYAKDRKVELNFGSFHGEMSAFEINEEDQNPKTERFKNFKEYTAWLYDNDSEFKAQVKKLDLSKEKDFEKSLIIETKGRDKEKNIGYDKEISDYRVLELAALKKYNDDQRSNVLRQVTSTMGQVGRQVHEVESFNKMFSKAIELSKEDSDNVYISKDLMGGRVQFLTESKIRASLSQNKNENTEKQFEEAIEDMIRIKDGVVKGIGKKDLGVDKIIINGYQSGDFNLKDRDNVLGQFKFTRENYLHQLKDMYDKVDDKVYKTISEVAKEQNKKSFQELGMEIYEKNKKLKAQGKDQLYFAIENIFPEQYGSHPDELLDIVKTAQNSMAEKLQSEFKLNKEKATEISKQSVKATFDTGHLHMWKKYFQRNKGESDEVYDKRFNDWAISQTKKLVDANVIGNVHLADNFGSEDDHLTLGQGTVPIAEYLKLFDKAKSEGKMVGKISVEGFDDSGEHSGVHEAWKTTGSQMFRSQQATDKWVNLEDDFGTSYGFGKVSDSYLTNTHKPYFVFGKYAPASDPNDWAPWDEMGLE